MNDYISREAAMAKFEDVHPMIRSVAQVILKHVPADDVVEVVRCRECFRYDPETHYCENTGCECDPWEFCSDGEQKDGADNG